MLLIGMSVLSQSDCGEKRIRKSPGKWQENIKQRTQKSGPNTMIGIIESTRNT